METAEQQQDKKSCNKTSLNILKNKIKKYTRYTPTL